MGRQHESHTVSLNTMVKKARWVRNELKQRPRWPHLASAGVPRSSGDARIADVARTRPLAQESEYLRRISWLVNAVLSCACVGATPLLRSAFPDQWLCAIAKLRQRPRSEDLKGALTRGKFSTHITMAKQKELKKKKLSSRTLARVNWGRLQLLTGSFMIMGLI